MFEFFNFDLFLFLNFLFIPFFLKIPPSVCGSLDWECIRPPHVVHFLPTLPAIPLSIRHAPRLHQHLWEQIRQAPTPLFFFFLNCFCQLLLLGKSYFLLFFCLFFVHFYFFLLIFVYFLLIFISFCYFLFIFLLIFISLLFFVNFYFFLFIFLIFSFFQPLT